MPLFKHKIASPGQYKVGDRIVDVDVDLLRHWADTSKEWLKSDLSIPVPVGHTDDPTANRGWVKDVWLDGEWLMGEFELDEPIKSGVSLSSPAKYVDGKGKEWANPITHVALTNEPVIPNGDFYMSINVSSKDDIVESGDSVKNILYKDNFMIDKLKSWFGIQDDTALELAIKDTAKTVVEAAHSQRVSRIDAASWLTPAGKDRLKVQYADEAVELSLSDNKRLDEGLDFILSLGEFVAPAPTAIPEQTAGDTKSDTIDALKTKLYLKGQK